jgi:general secretion pathway protein G
MVTSTRVIFTSLIGAYPMYVAKKRSGFTLIELVIVVLVLGIIAAVAAPKLFDVTTDARENGTRQSLTTIRNAIELYRATSGSYPPATTLATSLRSSLQGGTFPSPQVGTHVDDNSVRSFTGTFTVSGPNGWAYNQTTGEFYLNDPNSEYSAW